MLKGREKSFSDVVLEFKAEKKEKGNAKNLLKFAGISKRLKSDRKRMEQRIADFRKEVEQRLR